MKIHPKAAAISVSCAISGLLTCLLRLWFLTGGTDDRGMLIASHPGNILVWVLTAATALAIFWFGRKPASSKVRTVQAPIPGILSTLAASIGITSAVGLLFRGNAPLHTLAGIVGVLAAMGFILAAVLRWRKLRPHFLIYCAVVVFLMLFPIYQYQQWSAVPQLDRYIFQLVASVCLMLSAYYRTALEQGGSFRLFLLFSRSAVFFCLAAIPGSRMSIFYLAMAIWMLIDSCTLFPRKAHIARKRRIVLPEYVRTCIDALEGAGFAAYAVGGCVRDSLLGLTPSDYDLCTAATPQQIQQVFSQYRLVLAGEKHGTVSVVVDGKLVEITTFRQEGGYQDNRHPDWVEFVTTVEEDLSRRDFTVNAMAYSPTRGFADPFRGREDLQNGILRAVGEPAVRFEEDALRILRGVRFAVRFGLTPEDATEAAMKDMAPLMDHLAKERILEELCKLLPLVTVKDLLRYAPVLTQVIPELKPTVNFDQHSPHHAYDLYTHIAHVTAAAPKDLAVRLAALLHDIGKVSVFYQDETGRGHFPGHAQVSGEMADAILLRLKAPTALRRQVVELIDRHMLVLEPDKKILRRWLGRLGWETMEQLLLLQEADMSSKGTGIPEEVSQFGQIRDLLEELRQENACLTIKDLAIGGHDLLSLGYEPSPKLGSCLQFLLTQVQEEALPNEKEALLTAAAAFLKD